MTRSRRDRRASACQRHFTQGWTGYLILTNPTYARAAATALEEGGCDGMVRFIAALAGYGEAGALGARDRDEATIA